MALSRNSNIRDALFLLGLLYEKGFGVDTNHKLSFENYLKATELGHIKANTKIAHYFYSGVKYTTSQELSIDAKAMKNVN